MALDIVNQLTRLRMQTFDQGYRCVAIAPVRQVRGGDDLAMLFARHCDSPQSPVTLITWRARSTAGLAHGKVVRLGPDELPELGGDPDQRRVVIAVPELIGGTTGCGRGLDIAAKLPAVLLSVPLGHVTQREIESVQEFLCAAGTVVQGAIADAHCAPPLMDRVFADLRGEWNALRGILPAGLGGRPAKPLSASQSAASHPGEAAPLAVAPHGDAVEARVLAGSSGAPPGPTHPAQSPARGQPSVCMTHREDPHDTRVPERP